ncbi:MAG: phenylalanine--tRNA ligase subunit beta, partial [Dehalococcoidales bacterium]
MKVSLNWLKQYVDIDLPVADIANRLTMAGSEVKGVQEIGSSWQGIVIGQITAVNPHPNADRLTLVTIDLGEKQETVVCGAPNVVTGAKVAFAPVGAELTDPHSGETVRLKSAKIRGVVSNGMACSEKELGISDEHEGILILPEEAPVGRALADYMGDSILNMDITPNRTDCLSMTGIAREIATLTGQNIRLPEVSYHDPGPPVDQKVTLEILDTDLCPRYSASLITGVKITQSPRWMQERLISYGMRPINNIVDVTNFVMLEYGQPLHAFDYEKIRGQKIIVRRATQYEPVTTLDGNERELDSGMLVISDIMGVVAVAGVMGGFNSEVTEETTSILLEAANFNAASIHYTGRTLGIPSEACMRFERGISPELTIPALKRATQLIAELGGGEIARGVVDVYPGKAVPEPILLSTEDVRRVLGIEFSIEQIEGALNSAGFECERVAPGSAVRITTPYWRTDISLVVDLIEEVTRIIGYDSVPLTMVSQPIPQQDPDPLIALKREIVNHLTGYGFQEIVTYSWDSLEVLDKLSIRP